MNNTYSHHDKPRSRGVAQRQPAITPRLGVSAVRGRLLAAALMASFAAASMSASQLLDSVVARVSGVAITRTDVEAALALGVIAVPAGQDQIGAGTKAMIDRRLLLAEVSRFPPAEPAEAAIAERAGTMKARAGAGYDALVRRTGLDDERVREMARDSLRIEAYIAQRFGTAESTQRRNALVAQWLADLRMRGDVVEITPRP